MGISIRYKTSLWRNNPEVLEGLLREALLHANSDAASEQGAPVDLEVSLANALMHQRRFKEASEVIQATLEKCPDYALARFWDAMLSFYLGDPWPVAWEKLEARWAIDFSGHMPVPADRLWDGAPLNGRSVWLAGEGGLGDQIQFVRFAPALKTAGAARVVVSAHETLAALLSTMADIDAIVACDGCESPTSNRPRQPLEYDVGLPMMSAPRLFRSAPDTLPATVPYLYAPADRVEATRQRIEAHGGRTNVGVCWRSISSNRSMPPELFYPLAEVPGVRLFGLGLPAQVSRDVEGSVVVNLGFDDVLETASAMCGLDLVISVDTMPAHLAGSLARPVWLLLDYLSPWRWPLDGETSPWYPTMRLFHREREGGWEAVIDKVAVALRSFPKRG